MNAIELLQRHHVEFSRLFREYRLVEDDAPNARRAILELVADALSMHARLEERVFYPASHFRKAEKLIRAGSEQHFAIKGLLAELEAMPASTEPAYEAKVRTLEELVQRHVQDEETLLFPVVQTQLGRIKLEELGLAMEELAHELGPEGDHPHPEDEPSARL